MSVTTVFTFHCDHKNGSVCKNEFSLTDAATKRAVKIAARKDGWLIRGAKLHLCPEHRPVREASAKKAAPKKTASKKPIARKAPVIGKKTNSSGKATPFVGGQSIGKMARSAKAQPAS